MGQIRSIHYNKIDITTLKLYPKPKFTINWENTIIPLGTNTTTPQNLVARFSTLNTSTLYGCSTSTQFIFLVFLEHLFFFSATQNCVSLFSLSLILSMYAETTCTYLYIKTSAAYTIPNYIRNSLVLANHFTCFMLK